MAKPYREYIFIRTSMKSLKITCKGNWAMGNCSVIIMLYSAVDVRFHDWRSALHDLAGIHTALPGICCAPVHPGAPGR